MRVEPASDDSFARFYRGVVIHHEWIGYVAKRGNLVIAAGGVIKRPDGQWIGFLDMPAYLRTPLAFKYATKLLKEAASRGAASVQVTCDETIPKAERFLVRLGFEKTEVEVDGKAIWQCLV